MSSDDASHAGQAAAAVAAAQQGCKLVQVEEAATVRFVDCPIEGPPGGDCGELEQRASDRGHGNPATDRPVVWVDRARTVNDDAAAVVPAPWGDYVDGPISSIEDLPEGRGAPMAEQRLIAARQYRRHPLTLWRQAPPTEGEDSCVSRVEPTACDAPFDRSRGEPELAELAIGDSGVLMLGKLRRPPIRLGSFLPAIHGK